MAKNKMEESNLDININTDDELDIVEVPINRVDTTKSKSIKKTKEPSETFINCLRNERVIVRYIPKTTGIWGNNPKHVLSGGLAENAVVSYTVPRLSSGIFVNVLTDSEKAFLEEILGLEYNALSVYKKVDNFWDDSNDGGIHTVRLSKQDTYLNLSDPSDYIKYKVLLANKDYIAPSLSALQDTPKATYRFVLINEGDETKDAKLSMSTTMQCYKEFGKIENDVDTLRVIVELIDGRPVSSNTKLEFLQTKINTIIQNNSKMFLKTITDPMLQTKVLIKKCVEAGLIANRGNYLYLRDSNSPLCENNEEPTLNTAAKYLNSPKHQEVKYSLEAKLK